MIEQIAWMIYWFVVVAYLFICALVAAYRGAFRWAAAFYTTAVIIGAAAATWGLRVVGL